MARTRRTSGVPATVTRTVKRVTGTTRRSSTGGDLVKAVQGLVKALPIADLDKRLAALEKSVQRLESEIRKAVERVGGAVRRGTGATATTAR
ncbi:MAG: hypothetical protein JWL78_339, partial [Chloroflexi bacterium]|nr:hypothetical protein [Chloroflexota bacterium]